MWPTAWPGSASRLVCNWLGLCLGWCVICWGCVWVVGVGEPL